MIKNNFKLFPTLVTKYDEFLSKEESNIIFKFLKNVDAEKHNLILGNASSTHKMYDDILDYVPIKGIKDKLKICIQEYENDFGLEELEISNSWFNIQNEGSVLMPHVHPESMVSGALYVNADDSSSKLYFENPNKFINYFKSSNNTEFSYEYYFFKPEIGTLILFPSWLTHGNIHEVNQTKFRSVISFNTRLIK